MTQGLVARLRGWPAYRWILLMAGVYFVAAFYGTWINYIDLHFNTIGIYDLSINQQALSSTVHGNYPYPFYEASNCGRNERCSFLQVHPIFLAYLVAPAYGLVPSAATLFAIQDVGLAIAAFPLFLLSRELTKSTRLAILTSAIYLVWLPGFSGVFSFHWEAFMPVEIFTIFYLWVRQRYLVAVPVVILAYVTLEIGSVFLFCVAAFFLLPWGKLLLGYVRARWRLSSMPNSPRKSVLGTALHRIRVQMVRSSRVRASLALLVSSVAAYIVLHEFVTRGGWLLGLPPLPSMYLIPLNQPVYAATFTVSNFLFNWPQKVIFWAVMLGTLGALPLLAPRTAVIWGPWIAYTTVTTAGFYHMGNQYGFLAAAVLFPGFVYGLVRLKAWADGTHVGSLWTRFWKGGDRTPAWKEGPTERERSVSPGFTQALADVDRVVVRRQGSAGVGGSAAARASATPASRVAFVPPRVGSTPTTWKLDRRRRRSWQIIGVVATGIVVFNLALNPLIPYTAGLRAQRPFAAQSNLGITGLPNYEGYNDVLSLIDLIPSRAVVAVSPDLLTLLSANPYAFPLQNNMNYSILPFHAKQPGYVLLVIHGDTSIPYWLKNQTLYNVTQLAVRAWAPTTYLGGMILFERNYTGAVTTFGTVPSFNGAEYTALSGIVAKPAGVVAADPGVPFGAVVTTIQVPGHSGNPVSVTGRIVQTPGLNLAGGNYTIVVNITGSGTPPTVKGNHTGNNTGNNTDVVQIHLAAFELPLGHWQYEYISLPPFEWKAETVYANLTGPVLNFQVLVNNQVDWFTTSVYSVTISPPQ